MDRYVVLPPTSRIVTHKIAYKICTTQQDFRSGFSQKKINYRLFEMT